MPLVWIPATLGVGLLIAAVYLGGRIVTAHSHASLPGHSSVPDHSSLPVKSSATVQAQAAAAVQLKSEPQPGTLETAPQTADSDQLPMIAPRVGQQYIQISALNEEAARRYVTKLRYAKLDPHVAPGPTPEVWRVLIGPFADQDALEQTRSDLARAGIKNFIRRY